MVSPGRKRQGRVSRFKIGEFKYFSRLWGIGVVPRGLVPGPEVIGQENSSLECENLMKTPD